MLVDCAAQMMTAVQVNDHREEDKALAILKVDQS